MKAMKYRSSVATKDIMRVVADVTAGVATMSDTVVNRT
jgi:hypothetical protein